MKFLCYWANRNLEKEFDITEETWERFFLSKLNNNF